MKEKNKRWILGFGLDADDGHMRITRGENFYLTGGEKHTHESMREKVIKFNESFIKRGKCLDDASEAEIAEVARKVGFKHFKKIKTS